MLGLASSPASATAARPIPKSMTAKRGLELLEAHMRSLDPDEATARERLEQALGESLTRRLLRVLRSSETLELGAVCGEHGLRAAAGGVPAEHATGVLAASEEPPGEVGAEVRPERRQL